MKLFLGQGLGQLLESQSNKLLNEKCLDKQRRKKTFEDFLRKNVAKNKSISILFDNLLREHNSEPQISKQLKQFHRR